MNNELLLLSVYSCYFVGIVRSVKSPVKVHTATKKCFSFSMMISVKTLFTLHSENTVSVCSL